MKTMMLMLLCLFVLALGACVPAPSVIVSTQTPKAVPSPESPDTILTPDTQAQTPLDESTDTSAPKMYSSYAHMVSCDFTTALAEFDYFDMLNDEEAIKWLIDNEGYTEAAARTMVDNFADSEFIEKNTSTQLRTIDLSEVQIKLVLNPDDSLNEGVGAVPSTMEDLYALWAKDPAYVFDYYFYYITVIDGKVVSVEQVYWP